MTTHITRIEVSNPNNKDVKVDIWKRKGRKNICIIYALTVPSNSTWFISEGLPILEDAERLHIKTRSRKLKITTIIQCIIHQE